MTVPGVPSSNPLFANTVKAYKVHSTCPEEARISNEVVVTFDWFMELLTETM